jgi:peptidyl-prolyl cis-trans isomerase SurA
MRELSAQNSVQAGNGEALKQAARRCLLAAVFVIFATAAVSTTAIAQQVVVVVNGSPITTYDIEQRSKFLQLSTNKAPSRQEVIEELINDKVKLNEAKRFGLDATDAEVERVITGMGNRTGLNFAQFTQALAARGVSIETLKARIKAEVTWNQLIRGRFPSTLQIDEKEVRDVLETKAPTGDSASYDYRLRPILFIAPKGSSTSVVEGRMREAEALRQRFQNCDEGITFARGLKDVAVRDAVNRTSADLAPALREILNNTQIGKLTKPEITAQGVQLFALCEKKETTTDTPQKRGVREEIFNSRFNQQSKRYLNDARRAAMIEYK